MHLKTPYYYAYINMYSICHVPHDSHVQYVVHTCMSCVVHGTCMYMYVHVHVCVNVYIIYI